MPAMHGTQASANLANRSALCGADRASGPPSPPSSQQMRTHTTMSTTVLVHTRNQQRKEAALATGTADTCLLGLRHFSNKSHFIGSFWC